MCVCMFELRQLTLTAGHCRVLVQAIREAASHARVK